ncbi:hypothetical protein [Yersinia pekkanenii]
MIPEMDKKGYPRDFAAAVTTSRFGAVCCQCGE